MLRLTKGEAAQRAKAKVELDKEYTKALQNKQQYEQIKQVVGIAHKEVSKTLGKENYTKEELMGISPKTESPLYFTSPAYTTIITSQRIRLKRSDSRKWQILPSWFL